MKTMKAVVAAAITLLGTLGTVIADGDIAAEEVGVLLAAVVAAYTAVYAAPKNAPT